ncbi:40S ribosomal protein S3a [Fukomys damarensis]|uniref:Small ribosomal subunit protein eS1 n=1 Tax=Fukomys damarensis TaxID=885580 RepID=A0A091CW17_FUKDA|nr:40S ribosomal protein S3a [Fukomys damarensis]
MVWVYNDDGDDSFVVGHANQSFYNSEMEQKSTNRDTGHTDLSDSEDEEKSNLSEQHHGSGQKQAPYEGVKKGAKKKVVDPFSKKDWNDVKAPAMLNIRNIGKTLVTRTQGIKMASDGLKGRVVEVSLAGLQNDKVAFRKFKLIIEDVQGKNCLTNFHGMDLTRHKMCSMVKKWQTMIKAHVDVKTTDGYVLRLFFICVGFTKTQNNQIWKTSYAQHQQVCQIRKMMEMMMQEVQTNDLKEMVNKLIPVIIGKDIEKACQSIYPLSFLIEFIGTI